ncbi:hypothetical protein Celaphus_00011584, partial [Cervus elaphus hippelaphus]
MNSLAPPNTAHQVQLFPGARSARNPHPPPFDKHRLTRFCCKIEGGAPQAVPLSHYTFRKTRRMRDRCIMATLPGIDQAVFQWETGLPILCELGVAEGRFLFDADPRQRAPDSELLLYLHPDEVVALLSTVQGSLG